MLNSFSAIGEGLEQVQDKLKMMVRRRCCGVGCCSGVAAGLRPSALLMYLHLLYVSRFHAYIVVLWRLYETVVAPGPVW